ncbi:MAG TPA: outer membrane protein assembly factor BamD [Pyrinomonadaceae bacterium]|jgi:outer membrane protein assembly factor BamD (BamD/ComL family)
MKKLCLLFGSLALSVVCLSPAVSAQGTTAQRGPDASVVRDPDLERDSMHNLEVARHYFKQRKAYVAAIKRCEEIIAGNPNFARMDEVLYIAGQSSLRLSENKGKQAPNLPADKLRDDAREYLTRLVQEFPESTFRKQADTDLNALGGPKAKETKQ